jgi:hypothetical protein
MKEFDPNRTPGTIIGAVAAGTVVVPFLIVYAFLFIARGLFIQVEQPDITTSRSGEAIAGFVALLFMVLILIGMNRLLNGRDRWVFIVGQVITFGVALDFLIDSSSGEPQVPAVVLIGAITAIVLACVPTSWAWVQTNGGTRPLAADAVESADQDEEADDPVEELLNGQG